MSQRAFRTILSVLCALLLGAGVFAAGAVESPTNGSFKVSATVKEDSLKLQRDLVSAPAQAAPAPPAPKPAPPASPKEAFRSQVLQHLASAGATTFAATVEVEGMGRVIDHNGDTPLIPASILKIYTATAALEHLGPDYRFRTDVLGAGKVSAGHLKGDLVLVGVGDPVLTKNDYLTLAAAIREAGVQIVDGNLIGDDSRYDRVRAVSGWKPTYMPKEIGPLSALAVDLNKWKKDPTYLADPALGNLQLFREALTANGVQVTGATLVGKPNKEAKSIASHYSPSLDSIVKWMLQISDNFVAEMLLKELGATLGEPSTEGGLRAVREIAGRVGVEYPRARDGSGLSRQNLVTTDHQVTWLLGLQSRPSGAVLESSLPVACGGGERTWMSQRLCGTPAQGRIKAKTGFLQGVRSLTGYGETVSGRSVWFSFILTGYQSSDQVWAAIDQTLVSVASFAG